MSAQFPQIDDIRASFSKSLLGSLDLSTGPLQNGQSSGSPVFLSSLTAGKNSQNNPFSNSYSSRMNLLQPQSSGATMATKVRTMSNVKNFAQKLKSHAEDHNKPVAVVAIQPPKCLDKILKKIHAEKPKETAASKASNKLLNNKLASSLFLNHIDAEEITSAITHIDYDINENLHLDKGYADKSTESYNVVSQSRYDAKMGAYVFSTSIEITANDPNAGKKKGPVPAVYDTKTASGTSFTPSQHYTPMRCNRVAAVKVVKAAKKKAAPVLHPIHFAKALLDDSTPVDPLKKAQQEKALTLYRRDHPVVTSIDGKLIALKKGEAEKYFGEDARVDFFEQYRKMNSAKLIIATHSSVATFVSRPTTSCTDYSTYSSLSGDHQSIDTNPFFTSRTNLTNPNEANEVSSALTIDHFNDNAMSRLGEDFYSELQSIVSKDTINRSIDKEILSHNSFVSQQYNKKARNLNLLPPPVNPNSPASSRKTRKVPNSRPPHFLPPMTIDQLDPSVEFWQSNDKHTHHKQDGFQHVPFSIDQHPPSHGGEHHGMHQEHYIHNQHIQAMEQNWHGAHDLSSSAESAIYSHITVPASPRTKYLSGCLREGLHPLPNLIIRKNFCTQVNFAHYSMGDRMGRVLAECIQDLPVIESINLADNNLTDESLAPLIEAIINIKGLQELDLSRNKIDGQSSDSLAEYVSRADCPLKKLTLQSADVDDGECDAFVQMLMSNKQLLELDLSSNLLGSAETLSPGTKTGGESIAEFMCSTACRLEVLKLAWNSIRMNSAVKLAEAVAVNNTLTYLDINCNGLGWAAGEQLGDAIMENRTLKTLLVSGNNFTGSSCVSICIGIVENLAMHSINISENPIGDAGAKMIMQTSMVVGSRVTITATNCNTIAVDERCWYDPAKPCREYSLNLSKPFDRAVAFHLLQVIATHSTFVFSKVVYEEVPGKAGKVLKLVQSMAADREKFFDHEQTAVLKGLRLLEEAASNTLLGTQLFYEADADNSGRLDKSELQDVLDKIGFKMDEDQLQDILAVFDVDGAGTIDLSEFLSLLKSQHRESLHRIKDMIEYPIMALSETPKVKYIPPRKGFLQLKVIDGFVRKKNFYTMSSLDQKYAYQMAKDIGDVGMMSEAIRNAKIRYNEALQVYRTMFKELGDKIAVLVKVIPLMMFPFEARQLVSKVTHDDRIEFARVKLAFGVAVRPIFGAYNGYYCLDLSKEMHRMCLTKLLEQSQTIASRRASESMIAPGRVGDTSQHGNWSAFRNEHMNGQPVVVTPAMFTPMLTSGVLEFDFSGGTRLTGGELRLNDKRLCKVLLNICLLPTESNSDAMARLAKWKKKAREMNNAKNLYMPIYQCEQDKAMAAGRACDAFYDNLVERQQLNKAGMKREEIKVNFMGKAGAAEFAATMQEKVREREEAEQAARAPSQGGEGPTSSKDGSSLGKISESGRSRTDSQSSQSSSGSDSESGSGSSSDEEDEVEAPDDASIQSSAEISLADHELSADEELNQRQLRIRELKIRLHTLLGAKRGVSQHAKAIKFVEVVDETFSHLWILSRHLALIVELFQQLFGNVARTAYFGSYCADVVVMLFARVIDLHNFETVFEVLSAADIGAVFGRLGHLNIFNPMKPEVTMELNLSRREERVVAKMIVYLSVEEPGINLTYKQFQWKREQDIVPGWDVTEMWMTEEGLSKNGMFFFTYYSGEGKNKFGCIPDLRLRKALCQLVLIDENEVIDEDDLPRDDPLTTGADHFIDHRGIWGEYLVPGCEQYSTFRRF